MRELLENALYAPTAGRFKVYIIDEVHMLSRNAFNAMLKTLEEPPEHVKFILATTDPQKVPVTVLSRCLQFNLKQIPPAQIRGQLENVLGKEGVPFETPALQSARARRAGQHARRVVAARPGDRARRGQGRGDLGAGDAGRGGSELPVHACSRRSQRPGPGIAGRGRAHGGERACRSTPRCRNWRRCCTGLRWRRPLPEALADDEPDRDALLGLAGAFSEEDVQLLYQIAIHGRRDLGLAPDEFAGFTMTLMRMLAFVPVEPGKVRAAATACGRPASGESRQRLPGPRAAPGRTGRRLPKVSCRRGTGTRRLAHSWSGA